MLSISYGSILFLLLSSLHVAESSYLFRYVYVLVYTCRRLCLFSGPMCILLQETVTTEKLTLRCSFGKEGGASFLLFFSLHFYLYNFLFNHTITLSGKLIQDCAGVILCAAERATQVALQVKKLHRFNFNVIVYFMSMQPKAYSIQSY